MTLLSTLGLGGPWVLLGGLLGGAGAPWVAAWGILSDLLSVPAWASDVSWMAFWGSCGSWELLSGSECPSWDSLVLGS